MSICFLRVAVFLSINWLACKSTETFGPYKYLTPVRKSGHADNPQRPADGRTLSH